MLAIMIQMYFLKSWIIPSSWPNLILVCVFKCSSCKSSFSQSECWVEAFLISRCRFSLSFLCSVSSSRQSKALVCERLSGTCEKVLWDPQTKQQEQLSEGKAVLGIAQMVLLQVFRAKQGDKQHELFGQMTCNVDKKDLWTHHTD